MFECFSSSFQPEVVRSTLLGHLTTLTHLDGVLVSKEEAAEAEQVAAASKINQVKIFTPPIYYI